MDSADNLSLGNLSDSSLLCLLDDAKEDLLEPCSESLLDLLDDDAEESEELACLSRFRYLGKRPDFWGFLWPLWTFGVSFSSPFYLMTYGLPCRTDVGAPFGSISWSGDVPASLAQASFSMAPAFHYRFPSHAGRLDTVPILDRLDRARQPTMLLAKTNQVLEIWGSSGQGWLVIV
jgi:hypothetical protein